MKKILFTLLFILSYILAFGREKDVLAEMTLYPDSGIPALCDAPEGYKPFYISHYGRHGSRALTQSYASEIKSAWASLSSARYKNALSPEGERLFAEVDKVYRENVANLEHLTAKGAAQHAGIARRMAAAFPTLIKPGAAVNVMASTSPRCIVSMASFTNTLSGEAGPISFRYACSPATQGYINAQMPKELKSGAKASELYSDIPKGYEPRKVASAFFKSRKAMEKYVPDAETFLFGLYKMAGNCCNLDIETSLADMIPAPVMEYQAKVRNRMIYLMTMESPKFGAMRLGTSDSLMVSMLAKADAAVSGNGPDVDLVFGHDFALATYMAMLGLECAPAGLSGKSIDSCFASSRVIPMAANLQQIFYRGADGSVIVRFLHNEREVALRGVTPVSGLFYRWEDVRGRMMSRITPRREVYVEGGQFHVQGLAYDEREDCMYMSFTSEFYKVDMNGKVLAGISGINGHLGAMVFDPVGRKVYASLELKDDSIGRNISKGLGDKVYSREESAFYVACIDVDKLTERGMSEDGILRRIRVEEACADYKASVNVDGKQLDHRFACSGIDGMAIAPAPGRTEAQKRYLYVAYGVYGDVDRRDNDYNILLAYPLESVEKASTSEYASLKKCSAKYFIHTGNTRWGIQNMAYDPASKQLFLAVYPGKKPQWPNHSMFIVDMTRKPFKAGLEGVPYLKSATQLSVERACHFKWGATGMCAIGDGSLYISENGKTAGCNHCKARIYSITDIK